jgi:hypothetical protein
MREWFKPIDGYEDFYEISNTGRVKTLTPKCHGRIMKPEIDRRGYYVVRLVKFGVAKKRSIHRMVYETFKEPLTSDDIIHHLDEDKLNNNITNLMKTTVSEHRMMHNKKLKPIYIDSSTL